MSASPAHPGAHARHHRTPIETAALALAAIFALVGFLGFIPGITTNYSEMAFAGPGSSALLLGIFQVSVLHNTVHVLFGAAGLILARTAAQAKYYLIGGGAVYLVIWLYGLLIDKASAANFIPVNTADNWLHAVLGVVMVALGLVLGRNNAGRGREL